ncbi:MAG TPA: RhuM family protein, partial [Bacteroidales bacterium]|nr:RhuM family protein [Bacteroidales bacterium]
MSQGEIILYKSDSLPFEIEVKIEDETVWLTQNQMVELFDSSKQNISLHISNIFKEGELDKNSVVKYSLTTANDGKKYNTAFYNLDVIISVGYRVKSQRGTQFRIWANAILKDYLLKGYAVHSRIDQLEHKINTLEQKVCDFDLHIKTSLSPHEGIFYDGQIFDAYAFV